MKEEVPGGGKVEQRPGIKGFVIFFVVCLAVVLVCEYLLGALK
jgi:hypothetical protein